MTQEQFRLDAQTTISSLLEDVRIQNGVPAAVMEDAINKYLVKLKDMVVQEFIQAVMAESAASDNAKEEDGK